MQGLGWQSPKVLRVVYFCYISLIHNNNKVEFDGKEIGFVGTVARHYELGPIALAVLKRNVPIEATLISAGVPATQELIKN